MPVASFLSWPSFREVSFNKNNLADHIHLMKVVMFQTFLPPRKTSTTARNSFQNEKSPFDLQSTLLQLNHLSGLNKKKKNWNFVFKWSRCPHYCRTGFYTSMSLSLLLLLLKMKLISPAFSCFHRLPINSWDSFLVMKSALVGEVNGHFLEFMWQTCPWQRRWSTFMSSLLKLFIHVFRRIHSPNIVNTSLVFHFNSLYLSFEYSSDPWTIS